MAVALIPDSSVPSSVPVHLKHTSGAKLATCEWLAHYPTTASTQPRTTEKSMAWLPVAKLEHPEERGSAYAPVTSFHEELYLRSGAVIPWRYPRPPSVQLINSLVLSRCFSLLWLSLRLVLYQSRPPVHVPLWRASIPRRLEP
jgi:hypothetical protein